MLSVVNHRVEIPGGRVLRESFNLNLGANARTGITGPSGCGKSLMMRQIIGSIKKPIPAIKVTADNVDFLPQSEFLFPWYSPARNYLAWHNASAISEAHLGLAEALNVHEVLSQPYGSLSGGERQRVALWTLMCGKGGLVAIDEPFTALDLERKFQCLELMADWLTTSHSSLLVISHDPDILSFLCDDLLIWPRAVDSQVERIVLNTSRVSDRADYLRRRSQGTYDAAMEALVGLPAG